MTQLDTTVDAVRRFNRFYTRKIGLLTDGILDSPWSLTEARVLYDLAHAPGTTTTDLAEELGLDAGYISRVVSRLHGKKLLRKTKSDVDRRRMLLELTTSGEEAFARLNAASHERTSGLLRHTTAASRKRILRAMSTIESELNAPPSSRVTYRSHRVGDLGWIVERHAELYHESHGWGVAFEGIVAEIVADLARNYDPRWYRTWIAEVNGERAGAIALTRRSKTVGQLRLLFVEPSARGLGIGARLVSECVRQARHMGYRRMVLFTVRGLDPARRLYEAEGFELVDETVGSAWSADEIEQKWEVTL